MLTNPMRAIWTIARRDFVAVVFSKAFIFFLLGPLFPVVVGLAAGMLGASVRQDLDRTLVGIAMVGHDGDRLIAARAAMVDQLPGGAPEFAVIERLRPGQSFDARGLLQRRQLAAVVTGTLDAPVLTATPGRIDQWRGMIGLFAARALTTRTEAPPPVRTDAVVTSAANEHIGQVVTAQAGQVLLFLLTMLLAGMVLSNLVEEKANKIIEVLAASIPMEALFLGKLAAMLAVSMVGIAVWGAGYGVMLLAGARAIPLLATPAVGWPLFLALGFAYFAMAYLLLGAMFLTIGGLANTVREVQTLSMPATMLQLIVFFMASFAVAMPGSWVERVAQVFPVSSPYAMLAHAAQSPDLLPHALALGWQALWVLLIVRGGALLFRRTVMKSGPAPQRKRRSAAA